MAAEPPKPPSETVVLDLAGGSFRTYLRWKTPAMADKDGKPVPLVEPRKNKDQKDEDRKPVPVAAGALPPDNWTAPDFDDSSWPRAREALAGYHRDICEAVMYQPPIYTFGNATEWSLVCLRGAFLVSDPAQVGELRLTLRYRGGAVVHVNGKELARGHLPDGKLDAETLAEKYPEEAYIRPDGKLYGDRDDKTFADRVKCRDRELAAKGGGPGVAIPAAMLRKGVNVVAVEVHAAPVDARTVIGWSDKFLPWAHAGVLEARVAAGSGAGLGSGAGPAAGIVLHDCSVVESELTWDFAHPREAPAALRLAGARNGSFSAKVLLSSAAAIRKPRATVSDLVQEGGKATIPAKAALVRWAEPAGHTVSWISWYGSQRPVERFDRLLAEPPAEYAPVKLPAKERGIQAAPAAVAPVWVTVRVPAEAAPGKYRGTLTVEAEGAAPAKFAVPVELAVHDWKLPDPRDFASRHNIYQSPDSVAQYYKVPLWSDRHFELIGKSFEVLNQVGSKVCWLPLIVRTPSLNNTESIVRWVRKQGSGSGVQGSGAGNPGTAGADKPEPGTPNPEPFTYDFSAADKYMDLYEKTCGKPAILQLNVWEHHAKTDKNPPAPKSVTVLDTASGKTESLPQPAYDTPENEAFWKPVLTELKKRLDKRGWYDVTAICYTSYCWGPSKEQVDIYKNIWPDGKWMNSSHGNPRSWAGTTGAMPVPYSEWVWGCGTLYGPERQGAHKYPRPWKLGADRIEVGNPRFGVGFIEALRDGSPLVAYRMAAEGAMQSNVRGLGRIGADFWPLPIGKGGGLDSLCDAYAAVGPNNSVRAMLSPGPDGAIFNERLEMFREGVQACEAIIYLQKALEAKKLDAGLAGKVEDLLDERARYYLRTRLPVYVNWLSFESSDWQGRDGRLFALCAEAGAAAAAGGK